MHGSNLVCIPIRVIWLWNKRNMYRVSWNIRPLVPLFVGLNFRSFILRPPVYKYSTFTWSLISFIRYLCRLLLIIYQNAKKKLFQTTKLPNILIRVVWPWNKSDMHMIIAQHPFLRLETYLFIIFVDFNLFTKMQKFTFRQHNFQATLFCFLKF